MPLLEATALTKHYKTLTAVNGVSLQLQKGECLGLLGPNGAGKTTTVEMLEGILAPSSGEVRYKGEAIHSTGGKKFQQEVGIAFQHTALQEFLTVEDQLHLFASFYQRKNDINALIEWCNLGEYLHQDARKLSGGQRQRMWLALALVNDPELLFLNEPTTGLDPQARRHFWDLLLSLKAQGKTILLTTHYMDEAYAVCDRLAIMDRGQIIAQGTPQSLLAEHFQDVVLELPASVIDSLTLTQCPYAYRQTQTGVEFSTPNVNGALAWFAAQAIDCTSLKIRPRTLEDLFLTLTGRGLRE